MDPKSVRHAQRRSESEWDCDFLPGEHAAGEAERYVPCEINVSSAEPFPPSAIGAVVVAVRSRLAAGWLA